MALALSRAVDIYGVDVPGVEASDRVRLIVDGRIPFDDNSFDVVVSNQVFDHTEKPRPVFAEIRRVLKPGGVFIALFPAIRSGSRAMWGFILCIDCFG